MTPIDELLARPSGWLSAGDDSDIVVSSRVRLARNLKDTPFPAWAEKKDCVRIAGELTAILKGMAAFEEGLAIDMSAISGCDKHILFERHLVSRELIARKGGNALVVRRDETLAVMINEEDHLRLQAILPGLQIKKAWENVDRLDSELEAMVAYAFDARLGYLTACPTNVGTGMRASVMLHLPGLTLMEEITPIIKGMGKIGLAVRGLWGEGTEASGNLFQISNQVTLGEKEEDIIAHLGQIVRELVEYERNARIRMMEKKLTSVRDHTGRALGILSHAHMLTSKEALALLSGLRLGLDLGIVSNIDKATVNSLFLLTQPAHLQKMMGRELSPEERDEARAGLVREKLTGAA
ncbi:MAG: protein arginine kinase [Spartobacteria bacterium]|nr:protein arginine kinase [Spartobacteria bacterium]